MPGDATITPCEVQAMSLKGEFDDLSDPQIQAVIDDVALQVNLDVCKELAPLVCKNLAAHILVMRRRTGSGAAGPVAAQAAGGVSRSYRTSGLIDKQAWYAYFSQTPYGQEYMRLIRIIPASPLATNTRFGFLYDTVP